MSERKTIFISKATPEDDEFVMWLAPKLEAAGYRVFADIVSLRAGDRWRKEITSALQKDAVKMLLCCTDESLAKNGVQEEIGIGLDLSRELSDERFVIPLRVKSYKRVFGIGELQYVNFVGSWANGLASLLDELESQNVPKAQPSGEISHGWEVYRQRFSINVVSEEEELTSNWVSILNSPKEIYYYSSKGTIDEGILKSACRSLVYPAMVYMNGIFTFMEPEELSSNLLPFGVGGMTRCVSIDLTEFIKSGAGNPRIRSKEASNIVVSMFRQAWEGYCRAKGLSEYAYSSQLGFHVNREMLPIGKRVPWGGIEERRSSMLRNISKAKVWEYGVTATPYFWPFPHFKFKSRVLFSELASSEAGSLIGDSKVQHKLRRRVCSAWRNKAWHGRLMAFMKVLSGDDEYLYLPVSGRAGISLMSEPLSLRSPVTTAIQDCLSEDEDERDPTTLGNFELEGDVE